MAQLSKTTTQAGMRNARGESRGPIEEPSELARAVPWSPRLVGTVAWCLDLDMERL